MADHGQFGFGRPKIKAMLASGLAVNKRCGLAGRPGLPEHGVNQLTHEGAAPSPRLRKRVNLCELGCLALEAQRLFHVGDRKSVVSGMSVSVRVDLGGRRVMKKK